MNKHIFSICFLSTIVAFLCSCSPKKRDIQTEPENVSKTFAMVSIPQDLTIPRDRANYLIEHYWDNFDFTDTTYVHLPEVTEQALVTYLEVLPVADRAIADASMAKMLHKASQNDALLRHFLAMGRKYLYDPNSPIRNEEFYIPVLKYIVDIETDEGNKERAKFDLDMLLKNRVGDKAANITYTLASGSTGNLYSLPGNYTLLMFYNPDCEACGETIDAMKSSPVLLRLQQLKSISVLAFYPDADLTSWKKHFEDIPLSWVNGYDKERAVETKRLYDLKAIPTLYLLDGQKKVILKDAAIGQIVDYLKNSNPMLLAD